VTRTILFWRSSCNLLITEGFTRHVGTVNKGESTNMSDIHIMSELRNREQSKGRISVTDLNPQPRADQRLGRKYRFDDPNMDLFFVSALRWGRSGGLDVGEAFEVASHITDVDADSWIHAFESQANLLNIQVDGWAARRCSPAAGEMRLKAFDAYRSSWQFAAPGPTFDRLYALHREAFAVAMRELALPATFFDLPYADNQLPGVFLAPPPG
jgi:hypothetical protein